MEPGAVKRASEVGQALGALFLSTRVPVLAVRLTGEIVAANGATLTQYGYALEELVGMRIQDLQATARPIDHDLARAMAGDAVPLDRRAHRRKDGSIVWVVPTAGPIDACGETLVVSVLKDVTALVGAEERARFDEERVEVMWQAAVEGIAAGFALLGSDDRVLRANAAMAEMCGTTAEALVGQRCREAFPWCTGQARCAHEIARVERQRHVEEVASVRQPLRIETIAAPLNRVGIATIHIARDLQEERAIRSQLVTADRLATIGRLCAGVAHEVNNPAGFVTLALQLLKDQLLKGGWTRAETFTLVDECFEAMMQINQIMRDVTGFTRERAQGLVDLATVANSAIRLAAHEMKGRARVERAFVDDAASIVRGGRLAQVVLNLLVNAAQAIKPGAPDANRIEVRVYTSGDRACIDVSDTGPGIAPEIGNRIFEPFFTTREESGGTGLGLWLSRAIVEEEAGTLTFENRPTANGGGARFTVSLPLVQAEAAKQPRPVVSSL